MDTEKRLDVFDTEIARMKAEGSWLGNLVFAVTVRVNGVEVEPISDGAKKICERPNATA